MVANMLSHRSDFLSDSSRSPDTAPPRTNHDGGSQNNAASIFETLSESLAFKRMDQRLMNIRIAHNRTCTWLFEQPQFKDWRDTAKRDEHHGFLWIKGKPGCGKSTIMKNALLRAKKERSHEITISYFFNARAPDPLEKSSLGMYRSLVHQLLIAIPELQSNFAAQFHRKLDDGKVDVWTMEELQNFILSVVESLQDRSLTVYIDALDEGEENDVRDMIAFLDEVGYISVSGGAPVSTCLSSRHYPHITIGHGISLIVEDQQGHDEDINRYVTNKLSGGRGAQHTTLMADVCQKASGVFLWVVLVVPMLNILYDQGRESAMQQRLQDIPAKLDDLFTEILDRDPDSKDRSVLLLQWVLFSYRPLSPFELYYAVEAGIVPQDEIDLTLPSQGRVDRYLLNCSKGLTEVSKSQPPVVQFIHETIRGFLLQNNGLRNLQPDLGANLTGLSHDQLRRCCVQYFELSQIPLPNMDMFAKMSKASRPKIEREIKELEKFPFFDYAINNVFRHANDAEGENISQKMFLRTFCEASSAKLRRWINFRNLFERYQTRRYSWTATLMYIFAESNLPELVGSLINDGHNVNVKGERYGNPLQAACFHGHEHVASLLLDASADVNARGGEHSHALFAALDKKHYATFQLLQDRGAIMPPELLDRGLFAAVTCGYIRGAAAMLDLGANGNTQGKGTLLPLQAAAGRPSAEMVELLLNRGTDNNGKAGPLHELDDLLMRASQRGHTEVVRLLLNKGANINAQRGDDGNALQAASRYGRLNVVQLLLNAGAVVNASDGKNGNALHAASRNGYLDVIQLLLDNGATINTQGGYYGNALQAASCKGDVDVVQLLLDNGAAVNAQGGHYGNALQAASTNDNKELVQLLLGNGAAVNTQGGDYCTELQADA